MTHRHNHMPLVTRLKLSMLAKRRKLWLVRKGVRMSDEHRAKISRALRRWHEERRLREGMIMMRRKDVNPVIVH